MPMTVGLCRVGMGGLPGRGVILRSAPVLEEPRYQRRRVTLKDLEHVGFPEPGAHSVGVEQKNPLLAERVLEGSDRRQRRADDPAVGDGPLLGPIAPEPRLDIAHAGVHQAPGIRLDAGDGDRLIAVRPGVNRPAAMLPPDDLEAQASERQLQPLGHRGPGGHPGKIETQVHECQRGVRR
jgi:hypothetical protein